MNLDFLASFRAPIWLAACTVTLFATPAYAQNPSPWCIPGTTLCAGGNGQGQGNGGAGGGATLGGSAGGQVTPQGADGHANGNANGNGQANGQANGGANGGVVVPQPPPPPPPPVLNVPAPLPPPTAPPVYASPPVSSNNGGGHGSPSAAFAGCAIVQVGLFSGFKAGGCIGVRLPGHALSLDLDLQVLGGGTLPGIDIVPAISVVVPLSDGDAYDRWNIRIGIPFPGAWVSTRDRDTGIVFRLPQVGIGYDVQVSSTVALRLLDVRAQLELRTKDVDTKGHWFEPAIQVGMGLLL
jgi:hypothetical protein